MKRSLAWFWALCLIGLGTAAAADPGSVHLISSSHQDTAWMDTPAYCRQFRIDKNIIPALEMMKHDPNYKFTMECMLHLQEFLEAHPERTDEIIELTRQGRFEWGATYNQPYESWLGGEELVRQLYLGRRWLHKNFPGCDSRVYFSPDVPARSLQMAQVLAKAGVPYLLGSRYTKGLYDWQSPDGSSILFWSMAHYINHSLLLRQPPPLNAWAVYGELTRLGPYYRERNIPPVYGLLNSADFAKPRNFNPLVKVWNGPLSPWRLTRFEAPPQMNYSTAAEFFDQVSQGSPHFDQLMGERPDVWLYITGPTHAETSKWRREALDELLTAEALNAVAHLLKPDSTAAPADFEQIWKDQLYIDHGIGGKNGHITDLVFQRKLISAHQAAKDLTLEASKRVFSWVGGPRKLGKLSSKVFNGTSQPVDGEVSLFLSGRMRLMTREGVEVPSQISELDYPKLWNVARMDMEASATASSCAGPDYGPEKAIDGAWDVGETHPEVGPSQAWQSEPGRGPHWLQVDLGRERVISQVILRHFGSIGKFGESLSRTTSDFQVQAAASPDGPWQDLVPPVSGNTLPLTVHKFEPRPERYVRVLITRGGSLRHDGSASILEMQVMAPVELPSELLEWLYVYGFISKPRWIFIAKQVPAFGYDSYLCDFSAWPSTATTVRMDDKEVENDFYRVTFSPGGVKSIYDKELGRELINPEKWLAGEVFTMLSVAPGDRLRGTDAGEFGSTPQPVIDETFDRVSNHKPAWRLVESGPVRAVFELTQELADVEVRQRVTVWHGIKRIDFDVDLINFNGRPWREFRMALPLGLDQPEITYEVPMGVVCIGRDEIPGIGGYAYPTVTYSDEIRSLHPRQGGRFIDVSDGAGGVTISTSVPVFDWIDPTGAVEYPVIQPVLLASRKSCNGQGNWYPQAGTHSFHFSITSHPGDWTQGWRTALSTQPLHVYLGQEGTKGDLPPTLSFFSLDAPNVMITAIKPAEDDDDVVVRMVEMEGRDTEVTLSTYFRIVSAARTDIIEEDPRPIPAGEHEVTIKIGHHAIETLKLKLTSQPE